MRGRHLPQSFNGDVGTWRSHWAAALCLLRAEEALLTLPADPLTDTDPAFARIHLDAGPQGTQTRTNPLPEPNLTLPLPFCSTHSVSESCEISLRNTPLHHPRALPTVTPAATSPMKDLSTAQVCPAFGPLYRKDLMQTPRPHS